MNPNTSISDTVLRRVRLIHLMRLLSVPVFSGIAFVLAVWAIGREVWVAKVFENMPALVDAPAVLSFFMSAFVNTDVVVQVLSVVATVALAWMVAGVIRTLSLRFA